MKNVVFTLLILLMNLSFISCSDDDDDSNNSQVFENLAATVKGQISCQTMDNGFVYEIEFDDALDFSEESNLKSIGITNLPENLKMEGTRILISIRQAKFPDGTCVTTFSPEYFFESTKVSSTP